MAQYLSQGGRADCLGVICFCIVIVIRYYSQALNFAEDQGIGYEKLKMFAP
jgi:hypothetical protein